MAAGERFNFDENGMVQLLHFMQAINETFWSIAFKSPLNSIPILKHFPPWRDFIDQANSKMENLRSFYKDTIQKHRQTLGSIQVKSWVVSSTDSVVCIHLHIFSGQLLFASRAGNHVRTTEAVRERPKGLFETR